MTAAALMAKLSHFGSAPGSDEYVKDIAESNWKKIRNVTRMTRLMRTESVIKMGGAETGAAGGGGAGGSSTTSPSRAAQLAGGHSSKSRDIRFSDWLAQEGLSEHLTWFVKAGFDNLDLLLHCDDADMEVRQPCATDVCSDSGKKKPMASSYHELE